MNSVKYNTQFKVKYNDIEEELLSYISYDEYSAEDNEYSAEDVKEVCSQIYREELLSVFGADDLIDNKLDDGMCYVYDIMITNEHFKEIIEDITKTFINTFYFDQNVDAEKRENLKLLILIGLFSQNIFYIMHKCVCQQIEKGSIDNDLLVILRDKSKDLPTKHFGI
jgi:hypothetical protein